MSIFISTYHLQLKDDSERIRGKTTDKHVDKHESQTSVRPPVSQ